MTELTPEIGSPETVAVPAVEPAAEGAHEHEAVDHHHSPEQIRREMRVYLAVFAGLATLTAATVAARFILDLPIHQAIALALFIAACKGFLVAGFFMHLLSEKKVIYGILALTVLFFIVLLALPVNDVLHKFGHY